MLKPNSQRNIGSKYGFNISVGKSFYANFNCIILDGGKVQIGDNVLFGPRVGIYTSNHAIDAEERAAGACYAKPVVIGNRVWIGGGVNINQGVTIGDDSIVGAGSVVAKDVPPNVIAAGVRSPQGRPPICQAGGSPRGQDFAARWADTIITDAGSVEAMKDYREGVRRRARAAGRDPNSIKVLFLAYPLVDTTMEAAQERQRLRQEDANRHLDLALSSMSRLTNIDFSRFDRDEPIPELSTNGHQSSLSRWIGKTPREVAVSQSTKAGIDFTGTIDHVAGMMQEIMEEVGGDGFLFFNATFDRRYVMEV